MKYSFVNALEPAVYDEFVRRHPASNLLQTADWAKVKTAWHHYLTGLVDDQNQLVGSGLVLVRPLPFKQSMWYLPKGPLLDYADQAMVQAYLTGLVQFAKSQGATVIKLDPPIVRRSLKLEDYPGEIDPIAQTQVDLIERLGFQHLGYSLDMEATIQPRFSAMTFYDEAFLDQLPNRTKRFVKDTESRFVTVAREGRDSLADFAFVISQTEEHKGIQLRDQAYFETIWDAFGDETYLYLARIDVEDALRQMTDKLTAVEAELANCPATAPKKIKQLEIQVDAYQKQVEFLQERLNVDGPKQVVAGALGVDFGYGFELLYAGRNNAFSKIPAQDAIYVTSMKQAFDRGAHYVSTGGVPGTLDDGLTKFKAAFNPEFVETVGEFDYPVKRLMYRLMMMAIELRRKRMRHS